MNMTMRHGVLETRLLFRRKTTAFAASVLPVGLCVMTGSPCGTAHRRTGDRWSATGS